MRAILTILLAILFTTCFAQNKSSGWTAVYAHDENGKPTFGSLTELMEGMRKGYALKVGWSWTRTLGDSTVTLEHFAEPVFTTIIQRKTVSIVLPDHPLLKSYLDAGKQEFENPENIWQCILTTQGTFNAKVFKRSTGEEVRNWPQRQKMTWYLEYP
jgi:hypothetical protein